MDTYSPTIHGKIQKQPDMIRCHRCNGTGLTACGICGGSGQSMVGADPNGHPKFVECAGCVGRRTARCSQCHGLLFVEA